MVVGNRSSREPARQRKRVEKRREDELGHNKPADSKELILHQASMEAMY